MKKYGEGCMEQKRKIRNLGVIILILAILLSSALPNPIGIVSPVEAGKYGDIVPTSFELALLEKINENRTSQGAAPLKLNTTLWWVARAHSQDMIDYDFFDHTSSEEGQFNGAAFYERVRNYAEYGNSYIGECIAMKTSGIDVEWCMAAWKNSPPHWDIIINPNLKEVGLGILVGNWDGYQNSALYTADFGGAAISVDLTVDASQITFSPSSPNQGDVVNITATIENNGNTDAFPVKVKFYDGDPGSGGKLIGQEKQVPNILVKGESEEVSVLWDTQGEPQDHNIYVVIDEGNIISETNENNNYDYKSIFLNIPNPPITMDFGWNLVSFPYIVNDNTLSTVLSSITGKYDMVSFYDSSDPEDLWKNHIVQKPSHMNDLNDLDNKIGFWVNIIDSNGVNLYVSGAEPTSPQTISLYKGWNLVGYPSITQKLRNQALNNLAFDNEIDAVQYYDTATDSILDLGKNEYMKPGLGYWIHATQYCQWIVGS
jgi:uncharacterized protein YkwD